jgi:hypothetical protein
MIIEVRKEEILGGYRLWYQRGPGYTSIVDEPRPFGFYLACVGSTSEGPFADYLICKEPYNTDGRIPSSIRLPDTAAFLSELSEAARELAQYASYAEIIGAIGHNRQPIRKWCDEVFRLSHQLDELRWRAEHPEEKA